MREENDRERGGYSSGLAIAALAGVASVGQQTRGHISTTRMNLDVLRRILSPGSREYVTMSCTYDAGVEAVRAMKILVVDDDRELSASLRASLEGEGFSVDVASNGESALMIARDISPDLVVLDIDLPVDLMKSGQRMDGISVLRRLREKSDVPVLMLTSTSLDSVKVFTLELGADDCLTKPFNPQELVARIRAILRRSKSASGAEDVLMFGELRIDPGARKAWKNECVIDLTHIEFELLLSLARRPGQVFSREQLLERAWKHARSGSERVVDTHMGNLRQKIEDDSANPVWITTVRGVGYRFEAEA